MFLHTKDGRGAEFDIREAHGSDYDGVIDCMNEVFAGKYLNPAVFVAGYLENRAKTEDYRVFVAVAENGEVAANAALYPHPWFDGSREVGLLAVRPEYRGFGLATQMIGCLEKVSKELGSPIVFGTAATHLTGSQAAAEYNGWIPCGFWFSELDHTKQAVSFNHATCKLSAVIYVKAVQVGDEPRFIHVPQIIAALAERIYKSLGLSVRTSSEQKASVGLSALTFYPNEHHRTCYVIVKRVGSNFRAEMEERMAPFIAAPEYTFILLLNMADPTALDGFQILHGLGFEFSGFMPLSGDADYIILCRRGMEPFVESELRLTVAARGIFDEIMTLRYESNET